MPNKKISALTALGGAPATGDLIPIVDISDTTDAPTGTTKKITKANLFTAPEISDFTNAQHDHGDADDGGQLTDAALSAPVGIAKGGTGQATNTAGFDALAPTTTVGDMIYHNGSDNIRLPKGTSGQVLKINSTETAPEWGEASLFFQQDFATSTAESLDLDEGATGSNADGSVFYFMSSTILYRFEKDTNTGMFIQTHRIDPTFIIQNADTGGIIVIGSYVYVFANDNTNVICSRFLAADLTGEQAMTVPTLPCTSTLAVWTDGVSAYVVSAQSDTTSNKWTLSGTTFSASATATLGFTYGSGLSTMWDGTSAYIYDYTTGGSVTIHKLTLINGSTKTTTTKQISGAISSDISIIGIICNISTNKMYLGFLYRNYNEVNADVLQSTNIRLYPVTKP